MRIDKAVPTRLLPALAALVTTRRRRIVVGVAALAVLGSAGVASAVALSGSSGSFDVEAISAPAVLPGATVSQSVAGLWTGDQVTAWAKAAGPDWLSVTDEGVVTGTAPASATSAVVTVEADGNPQDTIQVAVPVTAPGQQRLEAASWNLDDAGAHASWSAQQKELQAIAAEGVQVIGLQETGGTAAAELAADLGWYSWQSATDQDGGDLGLISAYPISDVIPPTDAIPAAAASIDVNGHTVRVWVTHLDESDYGPDRACFDGATDLAAHEATTTRATQAAAVASAMTGDIAASTGSAGTPVLLLGDLASPSASDWTAATSASHCNAGPVDWPVPDDFTHAGLADSYRVAYPDPTADPGTTWSPTVTTDANGRPEPQDRIDYVDDAGPLQVLGAESYATAPTTWPSDHAAAITLFQLTGTAPPTTPAGGRPALTAGTLSLVGPAAVGEPLRATTGAWPRGTTFAYRWYANGTAITSATRSTYTPTAAQAGRRLTVRVTGTLDQRSATLTSRAATVRPGTLTHTKPGITGTPRVGASLRARPGTWTPKATTTYRWYAAGRAIRGATKATLRLTRTELGKHITVRVTGRRAGYTTATAVSAPTKPVK